MYIPVYFECEKYSFYGIDLDRRTWTTVGIKDAGTGC